MRKATIAAGVLGTVVALVVVVVAYRALEREVRPARSSTITLESTETHPGPETHQGFLYGRITTQEGDAYEGRLRWGGDEEAFWGDNFYGTKGENPWLVHTPPEHLRERRPIKIFGREIANREIQLKIERPFMGRFGDIARIEPNGRDLRVTLKSGTVFDLDRFDADDLADGVRVWDATRGVVDFDERQIRTVEFLPTPLLDAAPYRLHGTVHTRQGAFTGFVQWDREKCVGTDEFRGRTSDGALSVRFDGINAISRESGNGARATLLDGREVVFAEVLHRNRGMYVEDRRYGRVLIAWDALERIDFSPGGSGPSYDDFPPGRPLSGSVTTHTGNRFTGRLVYDLDESEITETLDASSQGVNYTIPFGLIASIVPAGREEADARPARVTLHNGEEVWLERSGDLADSNAGMLIFIDGRQQPEYVPWTDVEQVDLDRPAAMYPPLGGR